MKRIGSAANILKEGNFHQSQKRLPEAYQLYLDATQSAVEELKVHPGFGLIQTAREALNNAEAILKFLAEESELEGNWFLSYPRASHTKELPNGPFYISAKNGNSHFSTF